VTTHASIPPLVYTSQVPGSRFQRVYGSGGVSFIVEPYPLPILNAWLVKSTLHRHLLHWLFVLTLVCVGEIVLHAPPSIRARICFSVVYFVGGLVMYYMHGWFYWRSGTTIRIDPDQLTLRITTPIRTRQRRWPREQITKVIARDGNVHLHLSSGRPVTIFVDSRDAAWLAATLRSELDIA
jgi:hypothetical protein